MVLGVEKKVYSFRLEESMVEQLRICAAQEHRTFSNMVETILWRYLQEIQKKENK